MLRKGLFAVVMFGLCIAFVAADTIKGKITKIDEKSVTVLVGKDDTEGKTYNFAKDCKFNQAAGKGTEKEEIKDGAKAEAFQKLPKKGANAVITTNDKGEVTEVTLAAKKKKV